MAPDPMNPARADVRQDVEQRLRLLLDSLTEHAVFLIDLSGTIASWNTGVRRLLGYEEAEFIGLPFATLFTPEDVAQGRPAQELDRALATGRSDDKRQHVRRDGSRFQTDGVVTVMRNAEGIAIAFSKVMHDVTAQHEASEALRVSEQQYRLLVESVSDHAIFMLDVTGHVVNWTPAAERLLGYTADDIVGQSFTLFFTPEDRQRGTPEQEMRTAETTGRAEAEGWRVRKDGSRFWGDEIMSPIRSVSGELQGFAKVVRDLTDRQRAELERERLYTQAQEANRLKDEFLGTVSHELRTPLNAILGWTHLLETGEMKLDESRRRRAIATIRRNAEIQAQLVDDLLDVSRIISGKMRLEIQPTDLRQVLTNAVESLQPAAEARGIALEISVQGDEAVVSADPDRLQQIVWNLLSNAIKFTPSGGRVCVEGRMSPRGTDIIVEDTGIGIAPEVLPFIFDRFRQGDSSTRRSHGGVGLGLAIVRHLVELHGGSVDAVSRGEGRGTTFTVRLPVGVALPTRASSPPAVPPQTMARDLPSLKDVRVLLVDDDGETREVLTLFLNKSGAQVLAAESAAQAVALLEQHTPDVIIADIGMPGEDGYMFINKVRTRSTAKKDQPPAIALTAYARKEDRERALKAGFQRHISKPADPSAVLAAVAELLPHESGQQPSGQ
jgi:PAS domain S-box-containing protein